MKRTIRPQSGTDKIKLLINPIVVKPLPWIYGTHSILGNTNDICLEANVNGVFLIINSEVLLHKNNYKQVCIDTINKVIDCGYFYPPAITGTVDIWNVNFYILRVAELELYFDFPESAISINMDKVVPFREQANLSHCYYLYLLNDSDGITYLTDTFYSGDYVPHKHSSSIDFYNKLHKDLHDRNRFNYEEIFAHPYPWRLEFRLDRRNCSFMTLDMLDGTDYQVYRNFLPILGKIYNEWVREYFKIKVKSNVRLDEVSFIGYLLKEMNVQRITKNTAQRIKKEIC